MVAVEKVAGRDKLRKCTLDIAQPSHITVVTAAANVRADTNVVVALAGARIGEVLVERTKIAGIVSESALCVRPLSWDCCLSALAPVQTRSLCSGRLALFGLGRRDCEAWDKLRDDFVASAHPGGCRCAGMLCNCTALGWGSTNKGRAVVLDDTHIIGARPPTEKTAPRI